MADPWYGQWCKPFFAAYGFGPYQCFFCRTPVRYEEVHVHHINTDRSCNHPYNLAGVHYGCHSRWHQVQRNRANVGWNHSPEALAKIAAAASGRRHSDEAKRKIGAASRGRKHTEETKAKMRASAARRWEAHHRG